MVEKENTRSRKIQACETKKKIYEAARQMFKKYGLEKVSVDSIVEAAGVSKGSFYVHFESKDALAVAFINDYVNEVDWAYKSYLEATNGEKPLSDILMSLAGKIADVITCNIGYENMKALYKAHITKTIDTDAAMSYNRELYNIFFDILSKGLQQGVFKAEIPADVLAKHFIMAIRGLTYEWCIRYPDFDLKEQSLKHFEILLNGIKK